MSTNEDKLVAEAKADVSKLKTDEQTAIAWGNAHIAWLAAFGGFVVGLILMYFIK